MEKEDSVQRFLGTNNPFVEGVKNISNFLLEFGENIELENTLEELSHFLSLYKENSLNICIKIIPFCLLVLKEYQKMIDIYIIFPKEIVYYITKLMMFTFLDSKFINELKNIYYCSREIQQGEKKENCRNIVYSIDDYGEEDYYNGALCEYCYKVFCYSCITYYSHPDKCGNNNGLFKCKICKTLYK